MAQLLLLVVLLGAVHWGRRRRVRLRRSSRRHLRVIRIPVVLGSQASHADIATLLLDSASSPTDSIGIVGGELCSRIQYIFARLEDSASIDDWSHVYNQRFIVRALETMRGQYSSLRHAVLDRSRRPLHTTHRTDLRASKQRRSSVASPIIFATTSVSSTKRVDSMTAASS